jgi:hypothetical protein
MELVRWPGTRRRSPLPQKAPEASGEEASAFWLKVQRAVKELLTEVARLETMRH